MAIITIRIRTPNRYLAILGDAGEPLCVLAPREITKKNASKRTTIIMRISTFPNIGLITYTCLLLIYL